ncbi:peptidase domain-containing ABC transporter [Paenibacillus sp. 23TSA30-6]|uniref:peptidase domain-containing ABC transporter n=1 Tax=Paenibacillus sp. 23TSA30-6 TaxID=2546104 RepID=UPI00178873BD|nr:peptidase domain-containing ABC transporter [Paenibacillus sp. 23TSA30-6]MBE0335395.1 peptidase domain-containing ABC transporter [Paenibacillus sp. 23TSA30-6]
MKFNRKVPYIEQMDQTECGICCIAMISAYYKKYISLFELRERAGNGRDGLSMYHLKELAEELGFETHCYRETSNNLSKFHFPLIAYWENRHFVVLEKKFENYYIIIDPEYGRKKVGLEDFELSFSNYILECLPGQKFQKQAPSKIWAPFLKLFFGMRRLVCSILIVSIILQILTLGMPMLTQYIIDYIVIAKNLDLTETLLVGIISLVLFHMLLFYLKGRALILLENMLDTKMTTNFFDHLLALPYGFFQLRSFGDILFRASRLRIIRDILSNQILKGTLDFSLLIVVFIYIFYKSVPLGLWVIFFAAVHVLFAIYSRKKLMQVNQESVLKESSLNGIQTEILYGIMDIKTSGAEKKMFEKWNYQFNNFIEVQKKHGSISNIINTVLSGLNLFAPMLILWIGSQKAFYGNITIGELIAFNTIAIQFFVLSTSLTQTVNSFFITTVHLRRVQDVLNTPREENGEETIPLDIFSGDITLKNVYFKYSSLSDPVLSDISLSIKSGHKVAILGKSGSGKSTLTKILIGLNSPSSGTVNYNNYNIELFNKSLLREKIGVISQEITLFNRTIFENITFSNDNISFQEVIKAAKIAQIHDEIMSMPMNYNTVISELGASLSGGQRQRVAIARAIVHNPSILVLDEATSALDYYNEQKIDEYFQNMNCTRIVITHRVSSVVNSNKIFIMDNGRIVEQGTHTELLNNNNFYKEYFNFIT